MPLSLKTAALAGAILLLTAGGAFAATMNHNSPVRANPFPGAPTVNWVSFGQHVNVITCAGSWCKIQVPGPDGWVKKWDINLGGPPMPPGPPFPPPGPPMPPPGGPFGCFYGPYGYVCI